METGQVTIKDILIFISDFAKSGAPGFINADIIPNGQVDVFDYSPLISDFAVSPEATTYYQFSDEEIWTDYEKVQVSELLDSVTQAIIELDGYPAKSTPVTLTRELYDNVCYRSPCYLPYEHAIILGRHITDADKKLTNHEVIVHEYIHSFHDGHLLPIEEEETEAVRQLVIPSDPYSNSIYNTFQQYEYLSENVPIMSGHEHLRDYSSIGVTEVLKLIYLNPLLFSQVNKEYYQNSFQNYFDIMARYLPDKVENIPQQEWLTNSFMYRSHPAPYQSDLYLYLNPTNNFVSIYILDNETVSYTKNFEITLRIYDYQQNLLNQQTQYTNQDGNVNGYVNFYFEQLIPLYFGKMYLEVEARDPQSNRSIRIDPKAYYFPYEGGLTGVIRGSNRGTLIVTSGNASKTIEIDRGYFRIPEFKDIRGEIVLQYIPSDISPVKTLNKSIIKIVDHYTTIIDTSEVE